MKKFAFLLSYQGTDFCGWQMQPLCHSGGKISVQECLQKAFFQITQESVRVVGSGRTDAGVHAHGQVAHVILKNKKWMPCDLMKKVNSLLPRTIKILSMQIVDTSFHAQFCAEKKRYTYYIQQGTIDLPFLTDVSWWVPFPLNIHLMKEASFDLLGKKEFSVFQASGGQSLSTIREVFDVQISVFNNTCFDFFPLFFSHELLASHYSLIRLSFVGSGFLKQMIRSLVGTFIDIGRGKKSVSFFKDILLSQERQCVGKTAPAKGLFLEKVFYNKKWNINFIILLFLLFKKIKLNSIYTCI